jgi:hypothetical protein
MKKASLLCIMLLTLAASVASAAPGVNLRWTNCVADGGLPNRNNTCTANTGSGTLAGSFELGADQLNVNGAEIVVDLASASPTLPDWWQFTNAGVCRQNALSIAANNCPSAGGDWAQGQASLNIAAYQLGKYGPNTARILCVNAVQPISLQNLSPALEYGVFSLLITNVKSTGLGSCAGCLVPVCLVFNSLKMTTAGNIDNRLLVGPADGVASNYATYQGGAGVTTPLGQGCPQATPTKNATWGSVKALYR